MRPGRILTYLMNREADKIFTHKVQNFKGLVVGSNEQSELYGELNEVNGFKFFNFKLLGPFDVHVYKGCKVQFVSSSKKIEVDSDTLEIYTDFSKKLNTGITSFDIDLEEETEELLRSQLLENITILVAGNTIVFKSDNQNLVAALNNPVEPGNDEIGTESTDPYAPIKS